MPGTYTLPSLATVFNALYYAGGPGLNGSFRNIKVVRNNKEIANIDLYEFLLSTDIVTYALCECIVIYGLLLFFLSMESINFYIFFVLGLVALAIYFPRPNQWVERVKLLEY